MYSVAFFRIKRCSIAFFQAPLAQVFARKDYGDESLRVATALPFSSANCTSPFARDELGDKSGHKDQLFFFGEMMMVGAHVSFVGATDGI
jgi:hypothetical protein